MIYYGVWSSINNNVCSNSYYNQGSHLEGTIDDYAYIPSQYAQYQRYTISNGLDYKIFMVTFLSSGSGSDYISSNGCKKIQNSGFNFKTSSIGPGRFDVSIFVPIQNEIEIYAFSGDLCVYAIN